MAVRDIGVPVAVLLKHLLQSAAASALVSIMRDFDHLGRPETEIVFTDKQIPPCC
jgi:hypothetical protein